MISDKKTYLAYCEADRLANSRPTKISIIQKIKKMILPDHIGHFLYLLRTTEYVANCEKKNIVGKIKYIYYLRKFKKKSIELGFSIPLNVFAPGLSIPHHGTIIVNPAAHVGKNCRLHACVNIGTSGGGVLAPNIGDNVYIGPGAILFGDIVIANNTTIAANATVNKSIDTPNVTVGGTPAIIIKENTSVWWLKNKIDLSSV